MQSMKIILQHNIMKKAKDHSSSCSTSIDAITTGAANDGSGSNLQHSSSSFLSPSPSSSCSFKKQPVNAFSILLGGNATGTTNNNRSNNNINNNHKAIGKNKRKRPTKSNFVLCPVGCGKHVPEFEINNHLDFCITTIHTSIQSSSETNNEISTANNNENDDNGCVGNNQTGKTDGTTITKARNSLDPIIILPTESGNDNNNNNNNNDNDRNCKNKQQKTSHNDNNNDNHDKSTHRKNQKAQTNPTKTTAAAATTTTTTNIFSHMMKQSAKVFASSTELTSSTSTIKKLSQRFHLNADGTVSLTCYSTFPGLSQPPECIEWSATTQIKLRGGQPPTVEHLSFSNSNNNSATMTESKKSAAAATTNAGATTTTVIELIVSSSIPSAGTVETSTTAVDSSKTQSQQQPQPQSTRRSRTTSPTTTAAGIPPPPSPRHRRRLVQKHSRLSVPVLKSILQKSVRRRKPLPAVRVAMEIADKAISPLLRRLPIIILEDSTLHPSFPLLVWFMVAESKGYIIPTDLLLSKVFGTIYEICTCRWQDHLPPPPPPPPPPPQPSQKKEEEEEEVITTMTTTNATINSTTPTPTPKKEEKERDNNDDHPSQSAALVDKNNTNQSTSGNRDNDDNNKNIDNDNDNGRVKTLLASLNDDDDDHNVSLPLSLSIYHKDDGSDHVASTDEIFVWSILLRVQYGGMKGDMKMLQDYAHLWNERFSSSSKRSFVPQEILQRLGLAIEQPSTSTQTTSSSSSSSSLSSSLQITNNDNNTTISSRSSSIPWLDIPRLIHQSSSLLPSCTQHQHQQEQSKESTLQIPSLLSLLSPSLSSSSSSSKLLNHSEGNAIIPYLTISDISMEAIDFHCSPVLNTILKDRDFVYECLKRLDDDNVDDDHHRQEQHHEPKKSSSLTPKATTTTTNEQQQQQDDEVHVQSSSLSLSCSLEYERRRSWLEGIVKSCMWNYSAGVNRRLPLVTMVPSSSSSSVLSPREMKNKQEKEKKMLQFWKEFILPRATAFAERYVRDRL